ncbi:MAG TPA: hypothetical protein VFB66_02010 [Tepidisphaeraceae bacterium]|nr:hypothetical protein [Tepidisphaeraceae bacterium]
MHVVPDEVRFDAIEHIKEVERMLRLIEQLSHGPASCDHRLVKNYSLYALARIQAAERVINAERSDGGGSG